MEKLSLLSKQEETCRELDDKYGLATALDEQAAILRAQGNYDDAMKKYEEISQIYRNLEDMEELQQVLSNQGLVAMAKKDFDRGMVFFKEREEICRNLGNRKNEGAAIMSQGIILHLQGNSAASKPLMEENERICRELEDEPALREALTNKGHVLGELSDIDGALEAYKEAEMICRKLKLDDLLESSLGDQARALEKMDDLQGILTLYRNRENACRESMNFEGAAKALNSQATYLSRAKKFQEALPLAEQAYKLASENNLEIAEKMDSLRQKIQHSIDLSNAGMNIQQKDGKITLQFDKDTLDKINSTENNQPVTPAQQNEKPDPQIQTIKGLALEKAGKEAETNGDFKKALEIYHEAENCFKEIGDLGNQSVFISNQGVMLKILKEYQKSLAMHREDEQISRLLENYVGIARAMANRAATLAEMGEKEVALDLAKKAHKLAIDHSLGDVAGQIQKVINNIENLNPLSVNQGDRLSCPKPPGNLQLNVTIDVNCPVCNVKSKQGVFGITEGDPFNCPNCNAALSVSRGMVETGLQFIEEFKKSGLC